MSTNKKYSFIPPTERFTPERRELLKQMMIKPETEDPKRLDFGYSKSEWGRVQKAQEEIDNWVKPKLTELSIEILSMGFNKNSPEAKSLIDAFNKEYKEFIKNGPLKYYPVNNKNKAKTVRMRLLSLFLNKVEQVL